MHILEIRRSVPDFAEWKARFDGDPLHRDGSGMRAYRVARSIESPAELTIQLDFEGLSQATAFRERLEEQWRAHPYGAGEVRILESMDRHAYQPVS